MFGVLSLHESPWRKVKDQYSEEQGAVESRESEGKAVLEWVWSYLCITTSVAGGALLTTGHSLLNEVGLSVRHSMLALQCNAICNVVVWLS
jgi:hypothetical protein